MEVWFMDEGRFGLKSFLRRYWSRRVQKPTCLVRPGYQNNYLFSSVNPVTGQEFTLELPCVNTEMMWLYLDHLRIGQLGVPILLVLDQAGWRLSGSLRVPEGVELVPLPPYPPKLNPVERFWQWLRRHVCRNHIFNNLEELSEVLLNQWLELSAQRFASICACNYL